MMKPLKLTALLGLLAAVLLIAFPLYAKGGNRAADARKIATHLDHSKFSLAKAVAAAEEHSKGRAISALAELNDKDELSLHVWCIVTQGTNAPTIMKCSVDAKSGAVQDMKAVSEFPTSHEEHAQAAGADEHDSANVIANRTVEAGCGMCIYKMPGVTSCELAVLLDGKPYLVQGAKWPNHDFCDRKVHADVTGRIEGDPPKFIASNFEPKD